MRATSLLNTLLGIKYTRVTAFDFDEFGLTCDVEPTTEIPRCGGCGAQVRQVHDRRGARTWRHLDLCGMTLHLRYAPRRVRCSPCGVTTELVPWAEPQGWFTHAFEQMVGYLAQNASTTVVSTMMRVAWRTVGAIIGRVVERARPAEPLAGLRRIGIDELSYRKHHKYVTVVVDHDTGRVVWAREGKNADTLKAFFAELGTEGCDALEAVTMFVYVSAHTGAVAAENALRGDRVRRDLLAMPRVTFTDPAVASVGLTEAEARRSGANVVVSKLGLEHVPHAIAARDTRGFVKLVVDAQTRRLLGVHILAPEAGEMIQETVLAIRHGITVDDLARTMHPYLTRAEGIKLAAQALGKDPSKLSCCAA